MGLAVVHTRAGAGVQAPAVKVEVHLANGLPAFHLVGMAETSVKEARDRVRSAMISSGFEFPAKRITVNLAPADTPKFGGRFDLAIAIGILTASGLIPSERVVNAEFVGELGLQGDIKPVAGIIPVALGARESERHLYHPTDNSVEVSLVKGIEATPAPSLLGLFNHLAGTAVLPSSQATSSAPSKAISGWDDVIGQEQAKRALTIAAAGFHHILFVGPPGTGKSMLANKMRGLLPPLCTEEALQVMAIHSLRGSITQAEFRQRPFRAPHHTSSAIALTGGGTHPLPGEVSLAHQGILFLDELPEFGRRTLDVLREPLETGDINITRAQGQATFPARFQLVAAMNPSPTGDIHDGRTTPDEIMRYLNRLSGPLLDRIDLQVNVARIDNYLIATDQSSNHTDTMYQAVQQVAAARKLQLSRQGKQNGLLAAGELQARCQLNENDALFFEHAAKQLSLSMRTFHRLLKVARTIADLDESVAVKRHHLSEALGYRALDTLIRNTAPGF